MLLFFFPFWNDGRDVCNIPCFAQLPLTLCSWITPGMSQGIIYNAEAKLRSIVCVQVL